MHATEPDGDFVVDTWDFDDRLRVALDSVGGAVVVRVAGDVDSDTADAVESTLRAQLPAAKGLIVDLSGVEFLASAGLNSLVVIQKQATMASTRFVVVAAQRTVVRPITLLGLDRALTLRGTVEEAVAALAD